MVGCFAKNLKTNENKTYSGFILKKINTRELFLLYAPKEKMLQCLSLKGNVIWQKRMFYSWMPLIMNLFLFMEGDKLVKKDILKATEFTSPSFDGETCMGKNLRKRCVDICSEKKGRGGLQFNDKLQKVKESRFVSS